MTIAELFVKLGVKGDGEAKKALEGVKGRIGDITTASLAAKAGVLAVVYGLHNLMSSSASAGASLMSYAGATGLSAETLQRWQYAARQFNVNAEEMENAITGVQGAMIKLATGQGAPAGMKVIAESVGIDPSRIRDTMYMMGKLAEYAKKEKNVDFANQMLTSFGLSLQMISAMRRGAFDPKNLARAPIYSNNEANQLQKVDVAWANLGKQFEMAIGHLTAKHGLGIVKDLSEVSKALILVIQGFAGLVEKSDALRVISEIFKGWGLIFGIINEGLDKMNEFAGGSGLSAAINEKLGGSNEKIKNRKFGQGTWWMNGLEKLLPTDMTEDVAPTVRKPQGSAKQETNNTNLVVHNHGVKDAEDGAHHFKKALQRTGRRSPVQGRAN